MSIFIISICAFIVSILTFFSGFGLGTVLTPIFAIWFPIELAVALTAIVHLLNNLFKVVLVGRQTNWQAVVLFGLPAVIASAVGAWVLTQVTDMAPIAFYSLFGREFEILPLKLMLAILMIIFTLFEILPSLKTWTVERKFVPIGGLLSGFFGGLSGHQGALRSIFLLRMGLAKESFIATGVVIACFIDVVRLGIYSQHFTHAGIAENTGVLIAAIFSAFAGAYIGSKLLKKVTMNTVQILVSFALILLAIALGAGLI